MTLAPDHFGLVVLHFLRIYDIPPSERGCWTTLAFDDIVR